MVAVDIIFAPIFLSVLVYYLTKNTQYFAKYIALGWFIVEFIIAFSWYKSLPGAGFLELGNYLSVPQFGFELTLRVDALSDFIEAYKNYDDNIDGLNFYDFCMKYFGKAISEKFMFPYNEKLWATDAKEMGIDWMGRFVPKINIKDLVQRTLMPRDSSDVGYNAHFYYPKIGGIDILPKALFKNPNTISPPFSLVQ